MPANRKEQGVEKIVGYTVNMGTSGRRNEDGTPRYYGPRYGEEQSPRIPNVRTQERLDMLRDELKNINLEMKGGTVGFKDQLKIPGLNDSRSAYQRLSDTKDALEAEIKETVNKARNYGKPLLDKDGNPIPELQS